MLHGADYNYEQWLDYPDVLARDFESMKACTLQCHECGHIFLGDRWSPLKEDMSLVGWMG